MRVNKLCISSSNKILLNPSVEKTSSVIRRSLEITDTPLAAKNHTPSDTNIPDWTKSFLFTDYTPTKILSKILHITLDKKEITKDYEYALKNAVNYAFYNIQNKKKLLGKGFHDAVYEIDNDYAIKIPIDLPKSKIYDMQNPFLIKKDYYSDLKTYYGGIIAEFGNIKFIRNAGKHVPAGVPFDNPDKIDYYHNTYIPLFAKVPQESFNNLLEDCATLNIKIKNNLYYHVFDYVNTNNVILKDNKLFWVDSIRSDSYTNNSISEVLMLFLNKYSVLTWVSSGFTDNIESAKMLLKKILLAGANAGILKSNDVFFTNRVWENTLKNLNINTKPENVIKELEKINTIENKELRVKETEIFVNKLLGQNS